MADAAVEYGKLVDALVDGNEVTAGQMFGKQCLKVGGKAFLALQGDVLAFKLGSPEHGKALSLPGSALWDPSGKGRPMKEWVAVPVSSSRSFKSLAKGALEYVRGGA
jgi:hypothetical protein